MSVELGPDDAEPLYVIDWHYDLNVMDSGYVRDIHSGKIYFAALESNKHRLYSLRAMTHLEASELKRVMVLNELRLGFTDRPTESEMPTCVPCRCENVEMAIAADWVKLTSNRPKVGTWVRE